MAERYRIKTLLFPKIEYPEDVKTIRNNVGIVRFLSTYSIVRLWRAFSDYHYRAGWVAPTASDMILFVEWLLEKVPGEPNAADGPDEDVVKAANRKTFAQEENNG